MIYFIMFQDHLFLFIKLKTIYKFKGSYSPLTQATDNINYIILILIHHLLATRNVRVNHQFVFRPVLILVYRSQIHVRNIHH